ncbi:MAG: AraC family transcriptional regulator, partial [Leptospiraceae bacterium]|nr:AraC family transcriptional regulator [Leptospiraceae bacterium]
NYSFPILLVLCFGLLITIFLFLGFITKETWILKLGIFSVGIISILLLYYRETYPMLFETLKMEVETKRYEKTQLNGINVEAIKERITELMEVTRIYKNDEIRLSDLADELLINQNQLSRILNETYKKNFNEFINNFRINEAKVLLIKQKDKTILSIAFEVGFNTKATFNSWFIKFTGMTPTEFRKKNV